MEGNICRESVDLGEAAGVEVEMKVVIRNVKVEGRCEGLGGRQERERGTDEGSRGKGRVEWQARVVGERWCAGRWYN